jgi:hypothetical protein
MDDFLRAPASGVKAAPWLKGKPTTNLQAARFEHVYHESELRV